MIKEKSNSRRKYTAIIISVLIIGGTVAAANIFFVKRDSGAVAASEEAPQASVFTFDEKAAKGWWQGATDEKSMVVFGENEAKGCFVSLEYKKGVVDVDEELARVKNEVESDGQYTLVPAAVKTLSLQTSSGQEQYKLHQSSIVVPDGAANVKRGQSFGYVQLSGGYVNLIGLCDTPEQLESVHPALAAFSVKL